MGLGEQAADVDPAQVAARICEYRFPAGEEAQRLQAILVRTLASTEPFEAGALDTLNIPFLVSGGRSFLRRARPAI